MTLFLGNITMTLTRNLLLTVMQALLLQRCPGPPMSARILYVVHHLYFAIIDRVNSGVVAVEMVVLCIVVVSALVSSVQTDASL
jgi:hypothetical protein